MCPKCGFANQAGYQFCTNCGSPLGAAAPAPAPGAPPFAPAPPMAAPPGYPTPYGYGPSPWEYVRTKQVDRTKTGVLLLLIGSLLSWVPYGIAAIGYLLLLIGAILVILGRKAFGESHARNVIFSIVLFVIGIIVAVAIAIFVIVANLSSFTGGVTPAAMAAALNAGLIAGIASAIIVGIAEILFTYGLQAQTGRIILWAAYGANVALSAATYIILSPMLAGAVTLADYDRAVSEQTAISLLTVVPAVLYAAADYLAWSRINRGEIPAQAQAPTMAGAPPVPPMPPR